MSSDPFIGEIQIYPYGFAPRGWAYCDGTLMPVAQYTALFSILGTTYGGDGRTTFGLPNLMGRVPMHAGRGPGLTPRMLGQTGGSETETLSLQQLGSHTHAAMAVSGQPTTNTPGPGVAAAQPAGRGSAFYSDSQNNLVSMQGLAEATGQGGPHTNVQPFLTFSICIALEGVYPPRS